MHCQALWRSAAFIVLIACPCLAAVPSYQSFPLSDTRDLIPINVKVEPVEYKGRPAVRLTKSSEKDGFALLRGTFFQDGSIEADIALKITAPPGVRMPGFVGIAFRAKPDASRYELLYIRPGNSGADDQAMRNHSVQYTSVPDYDWHKLRHEWPWVYEAYAALKLEEWTHVKIEVKGRSAALFLNGSESPSLIVDGLKGQDLLGGVALWGYQGEEAYISNIRISNAAVPVTLKNGSEVGGAWRVKVLGDTGKLEGTLQLTRNGAQITGTWSGTFGNRSPVTGTWREGYVELAFSVEWPNGSLGPGGTAAAIFAGWIDGDSAGGRMRIQDRMDGRWTAIRKSEAPL